MRHGFVEVAAQRDGRARRECVFLDSTEGSSDMRCTARLGGMFKDDFVGCAWSALPRLISRQADDQGYGCVKNEWRASKVPDACKHQLHVFQGT